MTNAQLNTLATLAAGGAVKSVPRGLRGLVARKNGLYKITRDGRSVLNAAIRAEEKE